MPVIADLHHSDDKQDPDTDPHPQPSDADQQRTLNSFNNPTI
jgi:hypothetical protein